MKRQKPAIVLDVGGVLVDFNLHDLLEKLSRRFGMEIKAPLPVDLDALFLPLQTGKRSWEAIPPVLNKSLSISIEPEAWLELWCHIFTGEVLKKGSPIKGRVKRKNTSPLQKNLFFAWLKPLHQHSSSLPSFAPVTSLR